MASRYIIDNPEPPDAWQGLSSNIQMIGKVLLEKKMKEQQRKQEQQDAMELAREKQKLELEYSPDIQALKAMGLMDGQSSEGTLTTPTSGGGKLGNFQLENVNIGKMGYKRIPTETERATDLARKVEEKEALRVPTQGEDAAALYATRMEQAEKVFGKLSGELSHLGLGSAVMQAKGPLGIGVPNWAKSSDAQSYEQAKRNFLTAVLRKESGAVISPTEFSEGNAQYFPQPGDKPEVIAQKKANRDIVIKNFIRSSGKAYIPDPAFSGQQNQPQQPVSGDQQTRQGKYSIGQVIQSPNGKKYRITGGDMNDPDVEEIR